jgi:hypothetical protein
LTGLAPLDYNMNTMFVALFAMRMCCCAGSASGAISLYARERTPR